MVFDLDLAAPVTRKCILYRVDSHLDDTYPETNRDIRTGSALIPSASNYNRLWSRNVGGPMLSHNAVKYSRNSTPDALEDWNTNHSRTATDRSFGVRRNRRFGGNGVGSRALHHCWWQWRPLAYTQRQTPVAGAS
jgi:hypothetical protein